MKKICILLFSIYMFSVPALAAVPPESLIDVRMCGVENIKRTASGVIARSTTVTNKFQSIHPCPSNGAYKGACPDWAIDHVIPLASGGCDAVSNMQWLPNSIKRTASPDNKDRWERKINATPPQIVILPQPASATVAAPTL
jgi:hypothetical protein